MKICDNIIISDSITVSTAGDIIVDIPERRFYNCEKIQLVIAQNIPDEATINAPVFITIGGTTTTYPLLACNGTSITASMIKPRNKYPLTVLINGESGVFKANTFICGQSSTITSFIPSV